MKARTWLATTALAVAVSAGSPALVDAAGAAPAHAHGSHSAHRHHKAHSGIGSAVAYHRSGGHIHRVHLHRHR